MDLLLMCFFKSLFSYHTCFGTECQRFHANRALLNRTEYLPEGLLRCGGGTSVWFHRAVSDGESPVRSPLGLSQASVSADMDTHTHTQNPKMGKHCCEIDAAFLNCFWKEINHQITVNMQVCLPSSEPNLTWTRSKISACSLSVSWERYFWMASFALGG